MKCKSCLTAVDASATACTACGGTALVADSWERSSGNRSTRGGSGARQVPSYANYFCNSCEVAFRALDGSVCPNCGSKRVRPDAVGNSATPVAESVTQEELLTEILRAIRSQNPSPNKRKRASAGPQHMDSVLMGMSIWIGAQAIVSGVGVALVFGAGAGFAAALVIAAASGPLVFVVRGLKAVVMTIEESSRE